MFTGHNLQFCSKLQRGFRKRPVDSFRPRKFSSSLNKVNTKHFGSINKLSCKDAKPGLSQLNAAVGVGNSHLDLTRLILCAISSDKSTLTPPKVKLEPYFQLDTIRYCKIQVCIILDRDKFQEMRACDTMKNDFVSVTLDPFSWRVEKLQKKL